VHGDVPNSDHFLHFAQFAPVPAARVPSYGEAIERLDEASMANDEAGISRDRWARLSAGTACRTPPQRRRRSFL
jgi:hypothetical protein